MKKNSDDSPYLTPSQLVKSMVCLHASWLDCFGDRKLRRQESVAERLVRHEGLSFQESVLESMGPFQSAGEDTGTLPERAAQTLKWLQEGAGWISQGVLIHENLCGIPDLLRRVPGVSSLGSFSYQPVEIKSHRAASLHDRLQLFFYACLLEPVLGLRPASGILLGPDGAMQEVPFTPRMERQFFDALGRLKEVREGRVPTKPYRCSACTRCLWFPVCSREWSQSDHVSLLSGVSSLMARKLDQQGIQSCHEVAAMTPAGISEIIDVPVKSAVRIVDAARSRVENRPLVIKPPAFPKDETIYYYDIETLGSQVFCHGVIRQRGSHKEEKCFFAETPEDEGRIWKAFLDFLAEAPSSTVYCWTFYERTFARSSWQRFGGNREGYEILSKALTDQCAFVRDHFVLPCRGYSIKAVAPYFGFRWRGEDANGMNCVAWYKQWLETSELSWRQRIMEYNMDDVRAMVLIDEKLRALPRDAG